MTRELVTAHPQMPVSQIAALLRQHRIRTLPVVDGAGLFQGLVSATDLVNSWIKPPEKADNGVLSRFRRTNREKPEAVAAEMMRPIVGTVSEVSPLGVLIDLLAEGGQQAVPVVDEGRLVGLVTRTDLIGALARAQYARDPAEAG